MKLIKFLSTAICTMLLCAGFIVAGCTEDPLGDEENTGQENNGNSNDNNKNDASLYLVQSDLNVSLANDLSFSGSANCYIVSNAGLYKFRAVKGNSSESVGTVTSVSILWETFGTSDVPKFCDLIKAFCYKDGYIVFQTADTFKEGNAVIAAKDQSGEILWSWHIWLTDQPQGQKYNNNAGTMMDRNLGAISATPGDVGALGLLYQWGRKDPFLGSSSILSNTVAKSTITWPSALASNTIAYTIANPTTLLTDREKMSNYDWCDNGTSSPDNTRWTTSETPKSIYDPCPAGWRVPDGGEKGAWVRASRSSSYFDVRYDNVNKGMNFAGVFGSISTIWYSASGYYFCRAGYNCDLGQVGYEGGYWSASTDEEYASCLRLDSNDFVYPQSRFERSMALSVRCIKE